MVPSWRPDVPKLEQAGRTRTFGVICGRDADKRDDEHNYDGSDVDPGPFVAYATVLLALCICLEIIGCWS